MSYLFLSRFMVIFLVIFSSHLYAEDSPANNTQKPSAQVVKKSQSETTIKSAKEKKWAQKSLGQQLYFDKNLSKNKTQSCATCHNPAKGFIDDRDNGVAGAASLGDDGESIGDRNAPTAAYAMFSPNFQRDKKGNYFGGQFHDGRETDLAGQAGGPPLNSGEMAMPDKDATVARIMENPAYITQFKALYGTDIFDNPNKAYAAMAESIARFEQTALFAPFDSKYDRHLRGEYKMTKQEDLGMTLFFSQQFTNCNLCHQLNKIPASDQNETFSNYQYHNIGTPINTELRAKNGKAADFVDQGLLDNPNISDPHQAGKFKVPTLRNVAVTAPYMHNGVFKELKTVVLFYEKYNSKSTKRQINPETEKIWRKPEIAANISLKELETGSALKDQRIDALVAFLETLTDQRYEHLLKK
jgi:cytochrome c peroxidase